MIKIASFHSFFTTVWLLVGTASGACTAETTARSLTVAKAEGCKHTQRIKELSDPLMVGVGELRLAYDLRKEDPVSEDEAADDDCKTHFKRLAQRLAHSGFGWSGDDNLVVCADTVEGPVYVAPRLVQGSYFIFVDPYEDEVTARDLREHYDRWVSYDELPASERPPPREHFREEWSFASNQVPGYFFAVRTLVTQLGEVDIACTPPMDNGSPAQTTHRATHARPSKLKQALR